MTNKEILSAALKSDYLSELSVFEALPDYRMSRSFDRKMHKLIRAYLKQKNRESTVYKRRTRVRLLAIAIIIATVALGTGGVVLLQYWDTFRLRGVGNNEYAFDVSNPESAPKEILDKYRITADLSGYKKEVISDSELDYWVVYTDDSGKTIWYNQFTKTMADSLQIGLGDVQIPPEKTDLGNYTALYYVSANGVQNLMWDNGDYIFELSAEGLSKEEAKALALSVKKIG